ncbi:hypothetical protein [Streptomyces sp. NPDC086989]|uniref:hypothetical protein n=1 Tax=Streptomyces sp. NPDC086989 TaxID=3365764 RepID=UPI003830DDB1
MEHVQRPGQVPVGVQRRRHPFQRNGVAGFEQILADLLDMGAHVGQSGARALGCLAASSAIESP